MKDLLIYIFGGIAFLSATFLLFTRNVLYSAFGLVIVLVSLAGIFVVLGAEFVAVAQLMIYVGGIVVLLLFAIMLTKATAQGKLISQRGRFISSILLGAGLYAFLAYLVYQIPQATPATLDEPVTMLGKGLLTDFLIPLEVIAILLLAVLVGALTIARNYYKHKPRRT